MVQKPIKKSHTVVKNFFNIFLGIALVTAIFIFAVYTTSYRNEFSTTIIREFDAISNSEHVTSDEANEVISHLFVLGSNTHMIEYWNTRDEELLIKTENELLAFSLFRQRYDQIRLIDAVGMEIIRVNYNEGSPTVVPKEELQDKSGRYYFEEALSLNQGEIYISSFDLNIENGEIELPYKPMIQVAMPVFDSASNKKGVLLVNYIGEIVLKKVDEGYSSEVGELMVLNKEGYWLLSEDKEKEWGFMFDEGQDEKFEEYYPIVWQKISEDQNGQLVTGDGLFTFKTLKPLEHSDFTMIILSFVPSDQIHPNSTNLLYYLIISGAFLLFLLGVISWFLARAIVQRKDAEKNIESLNDILKIVNKILRHDIKNKLTGIKLSLESYKADKNKEMLDIASESAQGGIELVESMKRLEGIVSSGGELQPMNLRNLMTRKKKEFGIPIAVKGTVIVKADEALCSVCDNIINNAIIHGKTKKMTVEMKETKNAVEVRFIDYGKGIPDDIKGKLFHEGAVFGETGHTGLGLYIVRKTIERYGGSVHVEDTDPKGATFVVNFPKI